MVTFLSVTSTNIYASTVYDVYIKTHDKVLYMTNDQCEHDFVEVITFKESYRQCILCAKKEIRGKDYE